MHRTAPLFFMRKLIHNQNWNYLTNRQIADQFNQTFGHSGHPADDGTSVTIQPNLHIVSELRSLESATLELLENRTASSVYRIRQTGIVYQLCQPNGELFEFDDYNDYLQADAVDELIQEYADKPVKFTVRKTEDGKVIVTHHEPPPFTAEWVGGDIGVTNIQWQEPPPHNIMQLARLMRKLGAFMRSYLR